MTQEMPSLTAHRLEMDELNHNPCHYNPHVAKEMTELTRLIMNNLIKQYSPSL